MFEVKLSKAIFYIEIMLCLAMETIAKQLFCSDLENVDRWMKI